MDDLWSAVFRLRHDVTLAIGVVLALCVTLHVLLRKREQPSAVGWIGLSWFAPFTGAISYALLGVNRVQRRARRLRGTDRRKGRGTLPAEGADDHLEALTRGIGRITNRPRLTTETIQVFHDGDEAYPAMVAAIAQAKASIGLSSYIFRVDEWGGRFIDALAEAHGRGVAVRVLVDGIGGGWIGSHAYHALRRRGVPAARFLHSPLPWRMPFLNLRSHKKILVIDGCIGFTGGMNIADANVMATHPKSPVQDTHFRVAGPLVAQLVEAFAQDWNFAAGEDLDGDSWFPAIDDAGSTVARVVDSGPDEDLEKIEFAVLQAIACARTSIEVMTPYFLPDDRLATSVALASMRGVKVSVVVPETSDHAFVDWASRATVGPMLSDGVRVWLCPPPFRHSKLMVVDGEWCLFGSCNWDMRSFRLNFELCIEAYDKDLAAALSTLMQTNRGPELTQADLNGRSLPRRLRDSAARLLLPYL